MGQTLTVKKEIQLNADMTKVWEVLTQPGWTKKYMFGCEVESDWIAGSPILWKGTVDGKKIVYVKGTIVSIETGRLLQYTTFDPNSGMEDVPANYTTVTYSLVPEHGHTILSVSQGDYSKVADGQKRYEETLKGWDMVLENIKELLEVKVEAV